MSDFLDHLTQKQPEKRWYVIHTYSGYEKKVKTNLEHRIESMGMDDKIFQVLVPEEDEIRFAAASASPSRRRSIPATCWWRWSSIRTRGSWFATHPA